MSDIVDAVFTFNEQVVRVEDRPLNPLTADQRKWLTKALREEAKEFDDAEVLTLERDMIVCQVDSLIDSIYFAIGGLKKMGLTREQTVACFFAVHDANMTKRRGARAKRDNFAEDAVKSDDWVGPEARIEKILYGG